MFEIGRICLKLAGRDAGREAVIVEILDDRHVLVDGNVRRRKCNIMHLEPTAKKIEIKALLWVRPHWPCSRTKKTPKTAAIK